MQSHRRASREYERSFPKSWTAIASHAKSFLALLVICFILFQLWHGITNASLRWNSPDSNGLNQQTSLLHRNSGQRRSSSSSSRKQLDKLSKSHQYFPAKHLQNLIIVACHSVYRGLDFKHPEEQSSWLLLDYQKVPGQTESFLDHIKLGIKQAAADPEAMLLFSGGQTRKEAGPRAEALGYWLVAEANSWFGKKSQVRERAFTEEHARDSFENLLFGLCRFYELTGHYPTSVVVVGYEFKRERFSELHRAALRWPTHRFDYVGTAAVTEGAEQGESLTFNEFEKDMYGCGSVLSKKKTIRDPFALGGYAGERCADLAEILKVCDQSRKGGSSGGGGVGGGSGGTVFEGDLPWDQL